MSDFHFSKPKFSLKLLKHSNTTAAMMTTRLYGTFNHYKLMP